MYYTCTRTLSRCVSCSVHLLQIYSRKTYSIHDIHNVSIGISVVADQRMVLMICPGSGVAPGQITLTTMPMLSNGCRHFCPNHRKQYQTNNAAYPYNMHAHMVRMQPYLTHLIVVE
jgi:hypothetical protein